jgi:transposase
VGRGTIDYKQLRGFNAEAGRRAVLEYLKTNCNVSETARMFGITRTVVYDILKKEKEGECLTLNHCVTSQRIKLTSKKEQAQECPLIFVPKVSH